MASLEEEAREHGYSRNDWLSILLSQRYRYEYNPVRRSDDALAHHQEAFFSRVS